MRDLPDQAGRVAMVTSANSGRGFEIARALAGAGAKSQDPEVARRLWEFSAEFTGVAEDALVV